MDRVSSREVKLSDAVSESSLSFSHSMKELHVLAKGLTELCTKLESGQRGAGLR